MLDIRFIDEESYPLEASESGDNAYYLAACGFGPCRPSYASCLAKCAARKKGALDSRYSECSVAIGKKICPALAMREEEKKAGKAIYFLSRPKLKAFNEYRARMERIALIELQETGKRIRKPTEEFSTESLPDFAPSFSTANIVGFRKSSVVGYEEGQYPTERVESNVSDSKLNTEIHTPDDYGSNLAVIISAEVQKELSEPPSEKDLEIGMLKGESPMDFILRMAAKLEK